MSKAVEDVTEAATVEDKASGPKETTPKRSSVPNPPKKRVSQACDRCRSRKDKCDGKKPACSTCAAADEVCTYDPATKKRGLPEGYVRGLEKLWGISLRKSEGLEEEVLNIIGGVTNTTDPSALAKIWNDKEDGETLLETWRRSNVYQELERLLPLLDLSDDRLGKRKRDTVPSRPLENKPNPPLPPASTRTEPEPRPSIEWNPDHQGDVVNAIPSQIHHNSPVVPREAPVPAIQSLPDRTWHLIDTFFSYTHCWLPIIEKHDLLRISYQYSQNNSTSSSSKSGNHAVLWAILAYADHQNGTISPSSQSKCQGNDWGVDELYKQAKSFIPAEEGVFELGHVQALLVLTLLNMGLGRWSRAWFLVGQAVRVAIDLGLNEGSETVDKKSRNVQVFLGCFALDTLVALHLGRTPQLRVLDVKSFGALEEDGSDEWNPWVDSLSMQRRHGDGPRGPAAIISTFNRLISLVKILNDITHDVSTGKRRADKCKELLDEVGSWGQILPMQFTLTPNARDTNRQSFLPHQYHLHFAHLGTIAAVYTHLDTSNAETQISNTATFQTFVTSACQAMSLLLQYSENFQLSIVPPTLVCFLKIPLHNFTKVPKGILDEQNVSYTEWQENMLRSLSTMTTIWPAFEALKTALTKTSLSSDLQRPPSISPSTATINRFNSSDQALSQLTPQSVISDNPSGYNPEVVNREDGLRLSRAHSDIRPPNGPAQSIPSDLASTAGSSTSWQDPRRTWNQFPEQPLADSYNIFNAGTFSSQVDGDSTFNEFAALDAMEW